MLYSLCVWHEREGGNSSVFSGVFKPYTLRFEEELLIMSYTVNSILWRKPVKGLYLRNVQGMNVVENSIKYVAAQSKYCLEMLCPKADDI